VVNIEIITEDFYQNADSPPKIDREKPMTGI
jgi:hypothetical protein